MRMKNIVFFALLFVPFLSCNIDYKKSQYDSKDTNNDTITQVVNNSNITLWQKFQTFDEFSMKGIGKAIHEPYVFVWKNGDSIIVRSSSSIDSIRVYTKKTNNVWVNHMEYEMWKGKNYIPDKVKWDKVARIYDRYFYNDSILEILTSYIDNAPRISAIIKTKDKVFRIQDFIKSKSFVDNRKAVYNITNFNNSIEEYAIKDYGSITSYVSKKSSLKIDFLKKAYGRWGLQPGINETCLYLGQDIRNFNRNHPNGIIIGNEFTIYETADEMPEFIGGINELKKYIQIKTKDLDKERIRVVVSVVIEKDGSLSNFNIAKSYSKEMDQKALEIVKKLPHWHPAILDGKAIRCRMLIPVTFQRCRLI